MRIMIFSIIEQLYNSTILVLSYLTLNSSVIIPSYFCTCWFSNNKVLSFYTEHFSAYYLVPTWIEHSALFIWTVGSSVSSVSAEKQSEALHLTCNIITTTFIHLIYSSEQSSGLRVGGYRGPLPDYNHECIWLRFLMYFTGKVDECMMW